MADTRRAMHAITDSGADPQLVAALLSAVSDSDAVVSFSLLRGTIPDEQLVMLANVREVLFELPEQPFRTGVDLALLARTGEYEDTGRSYRRRFEGTHGVFGLEFVGRGNLCDRIVLHTPASRFELHPKGGYCLDAETITLFVHHRIMLDALLEALELLGITLAPVFYVTAEDFLAEHRAAAAAEAFDKLF